VVAPVLQIVISRRLGSSELAPLESSEMQPVRFVTSSASAAVALNINSMVAGLGALMLAASLAVAITGGSLLWAFDRWFDLGLATSLGQAFPQVANLIRLSPARS
jgi:hypothetical protein